MLVDLGDLWRWAWADNADYLDGGLSTVRALGVGAVLTVVFLCFHLPLLYGLWAAVTRRVKIDPALLVWIVASLAVIPLGLRFFGHYYQQLVPPLAVLTGVAISGLQSGEQFLGIDILPGATITTPAGELYALGSTGRIYAGEVQHEIPSAPADRVVDPTGCGDAYRAGLLYGIAQGWDWPRTGRLGAVMGAIKIASRGAQNHHADRESVEARYRQSFRESPWG